MRQGTAVTKRYQRKAVDASTLAVPETVSVAMTEIAVEMREGLLALAVGAGLQMMAQLMEADVTAACGPRARHDPDRTATRHGSGAGSVTLGGRRVPVARPRARATDGSGEVPVPGDRFPGSELVTDTHTPHAVRMENLHLAAIRSQARMRWSVRDPRELESWAAGIELVESFSYFDDIEPRMGIPALFARIPVISHATGIHRYLLGDTEHRGGIRRSHQPAVTSGSG